MVFYIHDPSSILPKLLRVHVVTYEESLSP